MKNHVDFYDHTQTWIQNPEWPVKEVIPPLNLPLETIKRTRPAYDAYRHLPEVLGGIVSLDSVTQLEFA